MTNFIGSHAHTSSAPPFRAAGIVAVAMVAVVLGLVWGQFRGNFNDPERLTLIAARSGLSLDPGSKVTFNGVGIGRVAKVEAVRSGDAVTAKISLDVDRRFLALVPANVVAAIAASTVFGNKYVALASPPNPASVRIQPSTPIDISHDPHGVTTEFNTLFETVMAVAEKVDPVKLNQTLTATAQAFDGLGERFGRSIDDGNTILTNLNPRMPGIRQDEQRLADLTDVYSNASPELFDGLRNAIVTAKALNDERANLDQALMASVGFGNTSGEVFEKAGPYLARSAADFVPTSGLLNEYSPMIFCTIRNYHDVAPKVSATMGGNGYSTVTETEIVGAGNPYVYPDNLPRINAHGGPEGRPGCWQPVTRDLWPAPYLVMDTGASIAPYNHLGLGQPFTNDYVWGRQIGENTINP